MGSEKTLAAFSEGSYRTGLACLMCSKSNELKLTVWKMTVDLIHGLLQRNSSRKDKCKTTEPVGATVEDGDGAFLGWLL